ncbi:MAG: hypothetical protein D6722_25555, partial [Bacteroidetes bacterium]
VLTLLDAVSSRWTPRQATGLLMAMAGLRQQDMAERLEISQPAVSKLLAAAHWDATRALLARYETLVSGRSFLS